MSAKLDILSAQFLFVFFLGLLYPPLPAKSYVILLPVQVLNPRMRIDSLTVFRFVAALIVVNFHFGKTLFPWPEFFTAGSEMVTFFFVLSGFVMSFSYLQRENFNPGRFWAARFRRIAPAYYVALILSVYTFAANDNFAALVLCALYLQSWVPNYALSGNAPGWSLSVEVFFYLTFPAILWAIRRYQVSVLQVCLSAGAVWLITLVALTWLLRSNWYAAPPAHSHGFVFYFPLSHWSSFLLGIAGGMWFLHKSTRGSFWLTLLSAFAAGSIYYGINHQGQIQSIFGPGQLQSGILAPLYLLFIVSLPQGVESINRWLSARPLELLGHASYAIYIFQLPLWHVCLEWFPGLVPHPLIFFGVYLFILIVFSLLFFKYVEAYFSGKIKLPELRTEYIGGS